MLLMQNDPFRDFDFLLRGQRNAGHVIPMDAYRRGDDVWVHLDLPGVAADSVDIDVERGVMTISATRDWHREDGDSLYLAERPRGTFRRQVTLGESLDVDRIEANFADGVLTLRIPITAKAKPKKIQIGSTRDAIDVESSASA
jgi:HSP20 family protein